MLISGLHGFTSLLLKQENPFKNTGYRMVNFHCKYITHYFHVVFCSSVCCFIAVYVSISLLRNVEGGDPSPYASKKQRSVAPAFLS